MPSHFPTFPETCQSLLRKHLTADIFEQLKNQKTANGFTLVEVIHSGISNPDSRIGVYAGDEESYTTFAALFDPIIKDYHAFSQQDMHISNLNSNDLNVDNPDPNGDYILSTRIRVGRNLAGLPLGPAISSEQRFQVEACVRNALLNLQDDLSGTYYPLETLSANDSAQLVSDHFLFKEGDRFLEAAGLNRHWPEGRGIFHNREKTFLVWVNEEDQLRIISMQKGGDIKAVFSRLSSAINQIEEKISFSYTDHLGYITSCPTNLGTAMRASVHIRLPELSKNTAQLNEICDQFHLQIRGIHGEHSESQDGVFDISNRRRLGVSEVECVQDMTDGVAALIAEEKAVS